MNRFEIQDIVFQDHDGVIFRALDKSTNQIVSLRRFFPFGQDEEGGEGLDQEEGKAFAIACQQLSSIQHPALRRTIFGGTDPVDGMPFLVSEWIEGEPLDDALGFNFMNPSIVIGLIRQALVVSIILSEALKSEAIWIETKPESIIVNQQNEYPTFSFRICPFKWLGIQSNQNDLTEIINLVEILVGWESKIVSDEAGLGLGGWLKALRQNPSMSMNEALNLLPNLELSLEPAHFESLSIKPIEPALLESANHPTSIFKKLTIIALPAVAILVLIFFVYQWNNKKNDKIDRVPTTNQALSNKQNDRDFIIPKDAETIKTFETGKAIILNGIPRSAKFSSTKKSIYIAFSEPYDETEIRVVIQRDEYKGGSFNEEVFSKLIGKDIIFTGTVYRENFHNRPPYVKIENRSQFSTKESATTTARSATPQ